MIDQVQVDNLINDAATKHLIKNERIISCFNKLDGDFICITNKRVFYSNTVHYDGSIFIVSYFLKSIIGASYGTTGEAFIITSNSNNVELEFVNDDAMIFVNELLTAIYDLTY
jgi:hypothetical protein